MNLMPLPVDWVPDLYADLGVTGLLILFIIRELWPLVRKVFITSYQRKQEAELAEKKQQRDFELELERQERQAFLAAQEEDLADRKAEREARAQERIFRHDIDINNERTLKELSAAVQAIAQTLAAMKEQLNQLSVSQSQITTGQAQITAATAALQNFIVDSVMSMKDTVAKHHPPETK